MRLGNRHFYEARKWRDLPAAPDGSLSEQFGLVRVALVGQAHDHGFSYAETRGK